MYLAHAVLVMFDSMNNFLISCEVRSVRPSHVHVSRLYNWRKDTGDEAVSTFFSDDYRMKLLLLHLSFKI